MAIAVWFCKRVMVRVIVMMVLMRVVVMTMMMGGWNGRSRAHRHARCAPTTRLLPMAAIRP